MIGRDPLARAVPYKQIGRDKAGDYLGYLVEVQPSVCAPCFRPQSVRTPRRMRSLQTLAGWDGCVGARGTTAHGGQESYPLFIERLFKSEVFFFFFVVFASLL